LGAERPSRHLDDFHARVVVAFQQLEQLPGDGPLQAPTDISDALALGSAPDGVGPGSWVVAQPGQHDRVQSAVRLAVARGFSRCLMTCPEEAGIGLAPASAAKAASERSRPACDQLTSTWAALPGPMAGSSSSRPISPSSWLASAVRNWTRRAVESATR
jgi:hypothetical protein